MRNHEEHDMKTAKLYYLTTDPLNGRTAEGLASVEGIQLEIAEPRDLPRLERERAEVVLDWDFIPPEDHSYLLNGCAVQLVGVHGYKVGDSVASFLPQRGVVVSRHLDQAFVAALARRASAA
jgi:hypothetical protein